MKKRIVISVTNDLSMDQRVDRAARTLMEEGHDVICVGRKRKHSKPLDDRNYSLHRLPMWFERGKWFYLEFNFRLFWWLLFQKADILLANDMDTLLPNWLVARLRGKRLVYDSHEYWTEVPELISRPGTRSVWLRLEKWLFPRVDAAATVNRSIADIYQKKYGLPVHVIRNVPFKKSEKLMQQQPVNILIYQGAMNVGRGIELMIAAMEFLPDCELWLVGGGPMLEKWKEEATGKSWRDRVRFFGWMNYADLPPISAQAGVGMSLEEDRGMSYRLALPNKLFDYLQAGLPVVVADLPEMRRVVEEHGVGAVLRAREPEVLAEQVRDILERGRWLDLHARVKVAREKLCWEEERGRLLGFVLGEDESGSVV